MKVAAHVQQKPESGARSYAGLQVEEWTAEAGDYDTAKAQLEARLGEHWRLITIRVVEP